MYCDTALVNIHELIHTKLKLIDSSDTSNEFTNKQRIILIGTLANIRGKYRNKVDSFLDSLLEDERIKNTIKRDGIEQFIRQIRNSPIKIDMNTFRAVYGQLAYFKVGIFFPELLDVFTLALEEAINKKSVDDFFYCFVDKFSTRIFCLFIHDK